jgi:hypothetical protein
VCVFLPVRPTDADTDCDRHGVADIHTLADGHRNRDPDGLAAADRDADRNAGGNAHRPDVDPNAYHPAHTNRDSHDDADQHAIRHRNPRNYRDPDLTVFRSGDMRPGPILRDRGQRFDELRRVVVAAAADLALAPRPLGACRTWDPAATNGGGP